MKEFDFVQTWKKDLWDHKKYFPYTPGRVGQNLKTFDVTNVSWIPFTKKETCLHDKREQKIKKYQVNCTLKEKK